MSGTSNLYNALSGITAGISGHYDQFVDYDLELSGILARIQEIILALGSQTSESTRSEIVYDNTLDYIIVSGSQVDVVPGNFYLADLSSSIEFRFHDIEDEDYYEHAEITVLAHGYRPTFSYNGTPIEPLESCALPSSYIEMIDVAETPLPLAYSCAYEPFLSSWIVLSSYVVPIEYGT